MWLLHWLPLPLLALVGKALGLALYLLVGERRKVTLTNLGLCFPTLSVAQKSALARRHFMAFGRSIVELGLWWWASPTRIQTVSWCRICVNEKSTRYRATHPTLRC